MDLTFVFAALEDALDATHKQANSLYFQHRNVSYGDMRAREEALRGCLRLLEPHRTPDEVHALEQLGSGLAS